MYSCNAPVAAAGACSLVGVTQLQLMQHKTGMFEHAALSALHRNLQLYTLPMSSCKCDNVALLTTWFTFHGQGRALQSKGSRTPDSVFLQV
jgi:hypothetical protein